MAQLLHQMSVFMAHETPFELAALAAALLIWLVGGAAMWSTSSLSRKLTYVMGGLVLGYYELHMTWLWLALGMALIFWPKILHPKKAGSGQGRA